MNTNAASYLRALLLASGLVALGCGEPTDGEGLAEPPVEIPAVLATGQAAATDIELNSGMAYWTNSYSGQVARAPVLGGEVEPVAETLAMPYSLLVFGDKLFVSTRGTSRNGYRDGTIKAISLVDGSRETIATDLLMAGEITTDGLDVYWINEGVDAYEGSLMRWSPGATSAETLLESFFFPKSVAVSTMHVYFTSGFVVGRLEKNGVGPEVVAENQAFPNGLNNYPMYVFWVEQGAPNSRTRKVIRWSKATGELLELATGQAQPVATALDDS